jgi:dihydroorotase
VVKSETDRRALAEAVCSGHPKLFFGSDSAPHPREKKEGPVCAAGVFTSPCALPLLAELFEREGALDRLEAFVSEKGARFYGLPLNEGTITLEKSPWTMPPLIGGADPLAAGEKFNW